MANCVKCGAAIAESSAFCGACGEPARGSAATAAPASGSIGVPLAFSRSAPGSSGIGLAMNMAAALSYALGAITGVLFLVLDPYKGNRFVRFHAIQSIIFSLACVAFAIVWSILLGIVISIAGYWVLTVDVPLRLLIGLGIFVFWLYVMFQAYSEREYQIPFIGPIAAKQVH